MKTKLPITAAVSALLISLSSLVLAQEVKPERLTPPSPEEVIPERLKPPSPDLTPGAPKQEEREKHRAMREANAQAQAQEMRRAMQPKSPAPSEAKPWRIGVMVEPIDANLRAHLGVPENVGVVITEIMKDGPAARAGLAKNDIIVSANGHNVANVDQLRRIVSATSASSPALKIQMIHQGKRGEIIIKMDTPPPAAQPQTKLLPRPMVEPQTARIVEMFKGMERRVQKQQEEIDALEKRISEMKKSIRAEDKDDDKKDQ